MCTGCNQQRLATVQELEADLKIPKTTVSKILTRDLDMKHVMVKLTSRLLLPEQKEHHTAVVNDLIQTTTNEPDFLKKVITGGESWVYSYDLEMKAQSSQWKLPGSLSLKKVQQNHSKIKAILTCFLIGKVLFIMSMPLQAKQLIRSTTSMFFIG